MEKYFNRQRIQTRIWPPRIPNNTEQNTQTSMDDKKENENNISENNDKKRA